MIVHDLHPAHALGAEVTVGGRRLTLSEPRPTGARDDFVCHARYHDLPCHAVVAVRSAKGLRYTKTLVLEADKALVISVADPVRTGLSCHKKWARFPEF